MIKNAFLYYILSIMMKSKITQEAGYFTRYVDKAPDLPVVEALSATGVPLIEKNRDTWKRIGDNVYAPGKWTIKEQLQHIIDTERVFAYRAMRIARGDTTPLPGFDQDDYNQMIDANGRKFNDLLKELRATRKSSIWFFRSMDKTALLREGTASAMTMSPLLLGFLMCGHIVHHEQLIEERYLPLISG